MGPVPVSWLVGLPSHRLPTPCSLSAPRISQVQLYGGLLLFCGFVAYDTQLMIEKYRMGDHDAIW